MIHILYIIAITAEAMTAALSAGRRDMDIVGVCVIAWITALGGGTIRNVLFGHYPMSWIDHPEYLIITAVAALGTIFIAPVMSRLKKLFLYLDALGLVIFTIIGCEVAQGIQLPWIIVLFSGMITGCAGGVMRDVLCNDIPVLFRKEIYATASILTGILFLGIESQGGSEALAMFCASGIGLAIRLLSIRYEWQMPKFIYRDE